MKLLSLPLLLLAMLAGCQGETHAANEPKGASVAHTADGKVVAPGVPGSTP